MRPLSFTAIAFLFFTASPGHASQQIAEVDKSLTRLDALYPTRGPIPVIYAYGAPYERGFQIGTQIKAFDPDILPRMGERRWGWVMTGIEHEISRERDAGRSSPTILKAIRETMGAEIVDEYIEEMRGVADGSRASPFNDLFMVNLGWSLSEVLH